MVNWTKRGFEVIEQLEGEFFLSCVTGGSYNLLRVWHRKPDLLPSVNVGDVMYTSAVRFKDWGPVLFFFPGEVQVQPSDWPGDERRKVLGKENGEDHTIIIQAQTKLSKFGKIEAAVARIRDSFGYEGWVGYPAEVGSLMQRRGEQPSDAANALRELLASMEKEGLVFYLREEAQIRGRLLYPEDVVGLKRIKVEDV